MGRPQGNMLQNMHLSITWYFARLRVRQWFSLDTMWADLLQNMHLSITWYFARLRVRQ